MIEKIPVYGSISRPNDPDEGIKELKNGLLPWNNGDIKITYITDEFTSICPSTGQPDFNIIKIEYYPDQTYIESKCMKFYMWSFREYGIHCEHLANKIAHDLKITTKCKKIKVIVEQAKRGGISLISEKEL